MAHDNLVKLKLRWRILLQATRYVRATARVIMVESVSQLYIFDFILYALPSADFFSKNNIFLLSFLENYLKICSYHLNWSLGKWLLEVFNEDKRPKIFENFKNTRLSNKGSFSEKNDSMKHDINW